MVGTDSGEPRKGGVAEKTPKADRTRLAILDAARTVFTRKGFSGTTIGDITEQAHVTRANFYYYFANKTALFIELGTSTRHEAMALVSAFRDEGGQPSREAVRSWVLRYFAYLDRSGAFVLRAEGDLPPDAGFRQSVARSQRRVVTALGQAVLDASATASEADPQAVGTAVMAMLERSWSVVDHQRLPSPDREHVVEAIVELVCRFLA